MKGNALDFSFSGLKTAVLRWVQSHDMEAEIEIRRALRREHPIAHGGPVAGSDAQATLDLLASFQHAVIHELLTRAAASAEQIDARSLIVSGGRGLQLRPAEGGAVRRTALPRLLPFPRALHRQCRHDRRRRVPETERGEFAGLDIAAQANLTLA